MSLTQRRANPTRSLLRVAFAGTPDFAVPSLDALLSSSDCEVVAVYTQPDRRSGRGRKVRPSPIKSLAEASGVSISQPQNFRAAEDIKKFASLNLDVLVVAAYGLLLPQTLLNAVTYPINVHASLLPRWRGAAPIQRAIMNGDLKTGITIMRIIEKLDAGPIWLKRSCDISATDTGGEVHDRLAKLGASCLLEAIERIDNGEVTETPQAESEASYAAKIAPDERKIQWQHSALEIERHIRAFNPSPVATANLANQQCKIWRAEVLEQKSERQPGTLLGAGANGIRIATGDGVINLLEVQAPGKKPMSAAAFCQGHTIDVGITS